MELHETYFPLNLNYDANIIREMGPGHPPITAVISPAVHSSPCDMYQLTVAINPIHNCWWCQPSWLLQTFQDSHLSQASAPGSVNGICFSFLGCILMVFQRKLSCHDVASFVITGVTSEDKVGIVTNLGFHCCMVQHKAAHRYTIRSRDRYYTIPVQGIEMTWYLNRYLQPQFERRVTMK